MKKDLTEIKRNIKLYNTTFKEIVSSLKEKIKSTTNYKNIPGYLGAGGNGKAFLIDLDGQKYVVKLSSSVTQSNFEIKPLLKAKGIKNTAQLVSYSFSDNVVITKLLPGKNVSDFKYDENPNYTTQHIKQVIEKVIELDKKGIVIDPNPSNFMYDKKTGFHILDFHLKKGKTRGLGDIILDLRTMLTARKWEKLDHHSENYKNIYKQQKNKRDRIYLSTMIQFLNILKQDFPDILEDYKTSFKERQKDPNIIENPVINKEQYNLDDPEIRSYIEKLKEMGF